MKEVVSIEGKELKRISYKGQPVVTLSDVDDLHGKNGDARHSFFRHQKRYNEGIDYYRVPYAEWSSLVVNNINNQKGGHKGEMIFLSLQGYCKVIKPFGDDRAWRIQQMLINNYFKVGKARPMFTSIKDKHAAEKGAHICKVLYHRDHPIHIFDFECFGEVVMVKELDRALGKSRGTLRMKGETYPEAHKSIEVLHGDDFSRLFIAAKNVGVHVGGCCVAICKIELLANLLLYGNAGKEELELWRTFNGYILGTKPAVAMVPVFRQSNQTTGYRLADNRRKNPFDDLPGRI